MCEPTTYTLGDGTVPTVEWNGCPAGTTSTLGTSTEDSDFTTGGDVDGVAEVSPRRDSTYVVRCKNQYNEELSRGSCRMIVEEPLRSPVAPMRVSGPTVDIFIDTEDEFVNYGESVRVEWRSKNAVSCVIYGPGCKRFGRASAKCFKEIGRSGYVVGNIYETSEFVAECRGADRRSLVTDEVVIEVSDGSDTAVQDVQPEPPSRSSNQPTSAASDSTESTSLDELLLGE